MANIKCDLWCKSQINGYCNKIEIDIDDMQFNEYSNPKCGEFDSTKAECGACEYCNDGICDFDEHEIFENSKCTNGQFELCN